MITLSTARVQSQRCGGDSDLRRGARRRRQSRLVALLCALPLLATTAGCGEAPPSDPDEIWSLARPYTLAEVERRRDDWAVADAAAGDLPDALLARARKAVAAVPGPLRLLAISEDACIDSAHTIPHLMALADAVPGLEARLVDSSTGRAVMEAHPSPDGRAATPTVVLLDEAGAVRGCWVERPAPLQSWYLANPEGLGRTELYVAKTEWYEADGGAHVVREFVRILEAAASGTPLCGLPLDAAPRLPTPGTSP